MRIHIPGYLYSLTGLLGPIVLCVDHLGGGDDVEDGEERNEQQEGLGTLPPASTNQESFDSYRLTSTFRVAEPGHFD